MLTEEQEREIASRHAPAIRGPWDVERRGSISSYIEQARKDVALLLSSLAELRRENQRLRKQPAAAAGLDEKDEAGRC